MISEQVDMVAVDGFCMENKIERVDFIKCDTEGSETRVIKGAQDSIKKFRPFILCEVDIGEASEHSDKAIEIENFLKNISYEMFTYRGGKFVLHEKIGQTSNYFFVPAEKTTEI
jgi:non-homologous end joining protein Ku